MMRIQSLRNRKRLALFGRWLVVLLIAFQAQLALAACLSPMQSPAFAYGMAQQTSQSAPCENMTTADSAVCLGHCLQPYQTTDKQQPLSDGLPAIDHTVKLPAANPPLTTMVSTAIVATSPSPPARFLFCCLRN